MCPKFTNLSDSRQAYRLCRGIGWYHRCDPSNFTERNLFKGVAKWSISDGVDEGIQAGIHDSHDDTDVVVGMGEVDIDAQHEAEEHGLVWTPADGVSDDHEEEGSLEFLGRLDLP